MNKTDNDALLRQLADGLTRAGKVCATAESCTGGLIGALLTSLPGSSAWYVGGVISYANEIKSSLLGVPEALLAETGAVSRQVAEAMAGGALARLDADLSVAVTGIAGPDGGSPDKPVGTVWLAWAAKNGKNASQLFHFEGDREQIRNAAAQQAIKGLTAYMEWLAF